MVFKLENVVPWGRSLANYHQMFGLSDRDLTLNIVDCAGGPASFNAEMQDLDRRGQDQKVISCDPIYRFSAAEIKGRIEATSPQIVQGLEENRDRFVWQEVSTPAELKTARLAAMALFLADYDQGLEQGRYRNVELPSLPFSAGEFDLALCSHLLFTYSEQFDTSFHLAAIQEMCRIAKEARIFPLVENFTGETSQHLEPVINHLKQHGYVLEIRAVPYEFQKNGNEMLVVSQ